MAATSVLVPCHWRRRRVPVVEAQAVDLWGRVEPEVLALALQPVQQAVVQPPCREQQAAHSLAAEPCLDLSGLDLSGLDLSVPALPGPVRADPALPDPVQRAREQQGLFLRQAQAVCPLAWPEALLPVVQSEAWALPTQVSQPLASRARAQALPLAAAFHPASAQVFVAPESVVLAPVQTWPPEAHAFRQVALALRLLATLAGLEAFLPLAHGAWPLPLVPLALVLALLAALPAVSGLLALAALLPLEALISEPQAQAEVAAVALRSF